MYEKLHEKWNKRRNKGVHVQCNMNEVLQDNYLRAVLEEKIKKEVLEVNPFQVFPCQELE
jgi:hypothetical protein